jgi:hypothetical protein
VLEAWLTSKTWDFRRFHSQTMIKCHKRTVTFMSGNEATLSDDLIRRSLLVDLFSDRMVDDRAQDRKTAEIDEDRLTSPEFRRGVLATCCAMVRHWHAAGMPGPGRVLPSYQPWGRIVGGIVVACGYDDPLQRAELQAGGDASRTEFLMLLEAALEAHPGASKLSLRLGDWAAFARRKGLYHQVLGTIDDMVQYMDERRLFRTPVDGDGNPLPLTDERREDQAAHYMDRPTATKFGRILSRRRGMKVELSSGIYQFGARRSDRNQQRFVELVNIDQQDPF